jgi:hypothetical protein
MARRWFLISRLFGLMLIVLGLLGVFIIAIPVRVYAEGVGPTITSSPTTTLTPTNTPDPGLDLPVESATPESQETDTEPKSGPTLVGDAAAVRSTPTSGLFGTNLCLVGAIVLASIVVIVMVVYGVMQRVRP